MEIDSFSSFLPPIRVTDMQVLTLLLNRVPHYTAVEDLLDHRQRSPHKDTAAFNSISWKTLFSLLGPRKSLR